MFIVERCPKESNCLLDYLHPIPSPALLPHTHTKTHTWNQTLVYRIPCSLHTYRRRRNFLPHTTNGPLSLHLWRQSTQSIRNRGAPVAAPVGKGFPFWRWSQESAILKCVTVLNGCDTTWDLSRGEMITATIGRKKPWRAVGTRRWYWIWETTKWHTMGNHE